MDIFIDFETICVNCKEIGYSFGYGFKTIEYKGIPVLDTPQPYLNGACVYFEYDKKPLLLRSVENSHQSRFALINAKKSNENTILRYTYVFYPEKHPSLQKNQVRNTEHEERQMLMYIDVYRFNNEPYFFIYYSFRNLTGKKIKNFNFFQFYDFDIYGQESYLNDIARYNSKSGIIYQYDNEKGIKRSIFAGIGSTITNTPDHFECNIPQDIFISTNRTLLRDYADKGPSDCAVALQWIIPIIQPDEILIFPIMIVLGLGKEEFLKNCQIARLKLEKVEKNIMKIITEKTRQRLDKKLQKLSFSKREWCR